MKLLLMLGITIVWTAWASDDPQRFDTMDADEILESEDAMNFYINCLLDKGPCSERGIILKRNFPTVILNNCSTCSDSLKYILKKGGIYILKNKKPEWDEIVKKYNLKELNLQKFFLFLRTPQEEKFQRKADKNSDIF